MLYLTFLLLSFCITAVLDFSGVDAEFGIEFTTVHYFASLLVQTLILFAAFAVARVAGDSSQPRNQDSMSNWRPYSSNSSHRNYTRENNMSMTPIVVTSNSPESSTHSDASTSSVGCDGGCVSGD